MVEKAIDEHVEKLTADRANVLKKIKQRRTSVLYSGGNKTAYGGTRRGNLPSNPVESIVIKLDQDDQLKALERELSVIDETIGEMKRMKKELQNGATLDVFKTFGKRR